MMLSLSLARWWRNDGILSLMAGGVHTRETDDGSAVRQMVAQQWRSFSFGQRCAHERDTVIGQMVA
jgi:hypothetical protein